MLLRPYYAVSHDLIHVKETSTYDLVLLLLKLTSSSRLLLLQMFDIRKLLLFLRAVSKNETTDELNEFSKGLQSVQGIWRDLIEVINNLKCLRLVNQYSLPNDISELSIDSDEYEFLLEYVFDIDSADVQINIPLIEVQTTKFNKIVNLLEKHSLGLKISNDRLSVIKDSETLKKKLVELDLHNYENFEIVKTLKFETLNVIGNEIDNFTITKLVSNNFNLKTINFKNRSKDLIPLPNTAHIDMHYDIVVYDTLDKSSLSSLGELKQINELFLNFGVETDITLNWLKRCSSLKKLYFSLNFDTNRIDVIDTMDGFNQLEHLVLRRCDIKTMSNLHRFIMPELRTITLVDCAFDFSLLGKLNYYRLSEIKLINCEIVYDKIVRLPRNLQNFTIINEEIDEVKDLVFLTLQSRESGINPFCRINLNVNDFVVTLNPQDCHDIFMCKEGFGDTDLAQLNPIERSKITISIFPHFNWFDLSCLHKLAESKNGSKIVLEIYSLSNQYQNFNELEFVPNIEKRHYDVYELFEHLQLILQKEELNEKDKIFLMDWPYVCRPLKTENNTHRTKRRSKILSKDEIKNLKKGRGRKSYQDKAGTKTTEVVSLSQDILPYSCDVCKKSFARIAALNRHSLIHRDTRPFTCKLCGYSFKRADHLRVHKRACSRLKN